MNISPSDIQCRLELAVRAARDAGRGTLTYFQQHNLTVERKSDDSPVTDADREAEQLLRTIIRAAFPNDAIKGEELGEQPGSSGFRWIVDPIDGTKSFICGVPLYSTLIGVEHEQQSLIGVIYVPGLDESVYAAKGFGAVYTNGKAQRPARVSNRPALADGLFVTSQIDSFARRGAADAFLRLQQAAYITRTWGDGYGYLLVATGRAEAMVDPQMNLWDAAAIQPILEEAGGSFTDWQGAPTIYGGEGVATNGRVLAEVLRVTADYPRPW